MGDKARARSADREHSYVMSGNAKKIGSAPTVEDVMNPAVVTAYEGADFKEIAGALQRNRINAVPVIDSDRRVVGVVAVSDLLSRIAGGPQPTPHQHRLRARLGRRRKRHALT